MSLERHVAGFLITAFASSFVFIMASSVPSIFETGWAGFGGWLALAMPIVAIFVTFGGLIVGLPVYAYGIRRGWFETPAKSALTGALCGATTAALMSAFVLSETFGQSLDYAVGGAIAGAVAGLLWWLMVARFNAEVVD